MMVFQWFMIIMDASLLSSKGDANVHACCRRKSHNDPALHRKCVSAWRTGDQAKRARQHLAADAGSGELFAYSQTADTFVWGTDDKIHDQRRDVLSHRKNLWISPRAA